MADEDDDQGQDETPEPPQRLFTLTEAERTRQELEPFLVEAMDSRKKLSGLENELTAVGARIMRVGGGLDPYAKHAAVRMQRSEERRVGEEGGARWAPAHSRRRWHTR